ncbi:hypothetical protein UPYG_G00035720 [Umbra pygmaea]|uniref:trypsin n=1 Tax=Umbra pygmaea TaxID=75934 RepID=A0ABD0XR63_UMBPY
MVNTLNLGTLFLVLIRQVEPMYIYGGKEAIPHSRPYMVLLNMTSVNPNKTTYCDGFLVREDFVITAAHCTASFTKAMLGVHNVFKKDFQEIRVKKEFPHPKYTNCCLQNDIMLLKLEKNASFSNNVRSIDLPHTANEKVPKNCLVSGWGKISNITAGGSPVLREVNVTLKSQSCSKSHEVLSLGPNGPLLGDSGSPLVCNGLAYGVVSGGDWNNKFYMCLSDYLDWITETMMN